MDNTFMILEGVIATLFLGVMGVVWMDLTHRMKKLNANQVTTMQFILEKLKGISPVPAIQASKVEIAKAESEVITKVGNYLTDEIDKIGPVTRLNPKYPNGVRVIDEIDWNKIVDSLRGGVIPGQAAEPAAVPGPVAADPQAAKTLDQAEDPPAKTKKPMTDKQREALAKGKEASRLKRAALAAAAAAASEPLAQAADQVA